MDGTCRTHGRNGNAYQITDRKPQEKDHLERPMHSLQNNTTMYIKERNRNV